MWAHLLVLVISLLLAGTEAASLVRSFPSCPADLGTGLTIITHNDLYGSASAHADAAAIVLTSPMTNHRASEVCNGLSESLLSPMPGKSSAYLDYLAYEGARGPYWIAGSEGWGCKAYTIGGKVDSLPCFLPLPALCTQSAPLSDLDFADTSEKWQATVKTGKSTLTGFRDRNSFHFRGVRYAQQPERFTYSSPYQGDGQESALAFGNQCDQTPLGGSEDCFFLNIWTPHLPVNKVRVEDSELKPVMFWIHGGAFLGGNGSDPTFDGSALVSRGDVVVVTINYRVGTLGFLALNDGVTNGNFGLADQITALTWVREHIRDFGGNPDRITIFGQSAGAASVRALLASPKAIGMYSAAIMQSNPGGLGFATSASQYYTIDEEVQVAATPVLAATGCLNATSQVECLRGVDAETFNLLVAQGIYAAYLVVDGTYLTTDELELTGQTPVAHVPLLMGGMRDDGAAFTVYPASANATLNSTLQANGFNLTPQTLAVFPPTPVESNVTLDIFNTTSLVVTDAAFRCILLATTYSASKHSVFEPLYLYEFNRSYQLDYFSPNAPVCDAPPTPEFPYGDPDLEYFKCHSGELYYVFGTLAFNKLPPRDENDIPMSQLIVDSWSSFARECDPTPDPGYLKARGFTNTKNEIDANGPWKAVVDGQLNGKILEYPTLPLPSMTMTEAECSALGLPIDFLETTQ